MHEVQRGRSKDSPTNWQTPQSNTHQVNVDLASLRIVIRDKIGKFVVGKTVKGQGSLQLEKGEMLAVGKGFSLLASLDV